MNRNVVHPGQIWSLRGESAMGLVVCVFEDEMFGQDLRVLPIFVGDAFVAVATERDVIVSADHSTLTRRFLVACWNGQSVALDDLGDLVGEVTSEALDAARHVEMIDFVDDPERFLAWQGAPVAAGDARLTARERLYRDWEDVRTRVTQFRHAYSLGFRKSDVRPSQMFRGLNGVTLPSLALSWAMFKLGETSDLGVVSSKAIDRAVAELNVA